MSAQEAADYGLIDGIILNREEVPARRIGIRPQIDGPAAPDEPGTAT